MIFAPKYQSIEAAPLDEQKMAIILPDGRGLVIEGAIFDCLFVKIAGVPETCTRFVLTGKIREVIASGPLSTGEIRDRLSAYSPAPQAIYSALDRIKRSGFAERKVDPITGLRQWHLKGDAK